MAHSPCRRRSRLTSDESFYGSGIRVFSVTFLNIWPCQRIATSIPLYRTVVHVQNGARRQLRAPGESSPLGREFLLGRESPVGLADGIASAGGGHAGRLAACRRLRERPCRDLRARAPGNTGKAVDVVAERAG